MSEVKKWYIGVYGGEAQARPCSPAEFEIINEREGRYFVLKEDFDRVTADLASANSDKEAYAQNGIDLRNRVDALQQRLTAADERADVLEAALAGMLFAFDEGVGREWSEDLLDFARKLTTAKEFNTPLKPAEPATDEHVCTGCGAKGWTANCSECVPY